MVLPQSRNYEDSIRCSRDTKKKILTKCKEILFPLNDWGANAHINIPHGAIMDKLAENCIFKQSAINIPQLMIDKINIECRIEYLKYNKDKIDTAVSTNEIIEAIIEHYIKSGPRW